MWDRETKEYVHSSLNVASQMDTVVKKAFTMLALVNKGIEYRSWDVALYVAKTARSIVFRFGHTAPGKMPLNWKECKQDLQG